MATLSLAVAFVIGFGLPALATAAVNAAPGHPAPGTWGWFYAQHGLQAVLALIAIAGLRRIVPADYGLHWPRGRSYVGVAAAGGLAFALLSCAVLFAATGKPPPLGYRPTLPNVAGWLSFETLYVGPTEEVLFRGLLATYLGTTLRGRLRLGPVDLSAGGVAAAFIFGLSHWGYGSAPFALALAQQVYAFALGLFYAYCFERSGSLLAPIVAHNVSDGVVSLAALGGFLLTA
jgi:hypothetical protein